MSEERPLGREDFRRLMSHSPSTECAELCDEWKDLTDQWYQAWLAQDEDEQHSLELLIRAVRSRLRSLHCPDCRPLE